MQQQDSCHLSSLAPPSMGNNGEFIEVIAHDTHQDMVDATDRQGVCRRIHCLVQPRFWQKRESSACVKVRQEFIACFLAPAH